MTEAVPVEGRRSGYEHLAPLFAEHDDLPDGDPRRAPLRDRLIAGYQPVARNIARKYGYRGENPDDLEQVATLGLILAVDRFEPGREVDFLSFAVPTITGEVLRYYRDRSATIRMPRRLRSLHGRIYDAAAELSQRHGRAPRPSEIADHLGETLETVLEGLAAKASAETLSLDEPAWNEDMDPVDRTRFGPALAQVDRQFELVEYREALGPLLARVSERERTILMLRFFRDMTQTEIGEHIGVSQMHVSRLLTRTLAGLRRRMAVD